MTAPDRDAAVRTLLDVIGIGVTLAVLLLSGMLARGWLLVPATFWSVVLLGRLLIGKPVSQNPKRRAR